VFESVEVERLRGTYDRVGLADKLQPRKSFRLGRLVVREAAVQYVDQTRRHGAVQAQVRVESLVVEPLRSDWAVFDLLFRSRAAGQINGRRFSIATQAIPDGRQTRWQGQGLPMELVAPYLGGPLAWITSGELDVDVADRWQRGDEAEIEMHWLLVLRDIKAEVPADASGTVRAVAKPVVAFLNKHSVRLPLEFEVAIDRQRFHFAASPQARRVGPRRRRCRG